MSVRLRRGILAALVFCLCALWARWALAESFSDDAVAKSRQRYEVGQWYQQSGDTERARAMYLEALDLWPENLDAKNALYNLIYTPKPEEPPWWEKILGIPSDGSSTIVSILVQIFGWGALLVLFLAVSAKVGPETVRLWIRRRRGIPLLGLGNFLDPTLRLPGLPHYLATNMNDAGLTIYDEKGAIVPDFNFIGDSPGLPQAKMLAKLMEMVYNRQFQRIHVAITEEAGLINAAVSLADNATGYVRYLQVVSLDPSPYTQPGELVKVMARLVADAILVALSRDANTRGLLYQRMGDWQWALKEFMTAADHARKAGQCGEYYQAHLNLGNLYSFLGLQDKSVGAYTEVADHAKSPVTQTLIQAAMACSYRNWAESSPLDQRDTYDWLARQAMDKAVGSQNKSPLINYTIACYYSLSSRFEDCLRWLREAISGDLTYLSYAMSDPDMANLRRWLGDRPLTDALGMRL